MKKLALINSYCNTWEKLTILLQNVNKLKELGVDSLVYSPVPLPREITDQLDYVILSKENPIIRWPERAMMQWVRINNSKLKLVVPDYGWASVYQYKKLMEYGATLDYDYYFWFLYDLNIDSIVEDTLKNPHDKLFFPSTKASSSKAGGIFASFNKENLNKVHPLINRTDYINECSGKITEYYVEVLYNQIDGEVSNHVTSDLLHEHSSLSFNKANPNYPFKMYFSNENLLKFIFWEFTSLIDFTLKVNGKHYDYQIKDDNNIVETEIKVEDIREIGYFYNQEYTNITQYFGNTSEVLQLIENIN